MPSPLCVDRPAAASILGSPLKGVDFLKLYWVLAHRMEQSPLLASSSSSSTEVQHHVLLLHEAIVEAGLNSELPPSFEQSLRGTDRPLRRVDSRVSSMSYETAKTAKTRNIADVIVWLDRARSHLTTTRTADAVEGIDGFVNKRKPDFKGR